MYCLLLVCLSCLLPITKSSIYVSGNEIKIHETQYEPTWPSLDSRPLPKWYDEAKLGIFLHWGVYSVPSFGSEWFWWNWKTNSKAFVDFMTQNYPPNFTYQDFAQSFTAEFFDAERWANLFESSGAKYIVLTSKHHEGFALWPSKYSYSWNSVDVGPHMDLVGELANAVRNKTTLKFGLYHSLFEWFHPLYLKDKENGFKTRLFPTRKSIPEMKELITNYKPDILWSDGDADGTDEYWQSKEFLAWLYNDSPVRDTIVVNDRWGVNNILCHHGDFYTCSDRYNPGVLQKHKWENAMTIDSKSWGYRRNGVVSDYLSIKTLIKELVTTVSCGGNLNMNIGPTKDGMIAPIFQERLLQMGLWLGYNGEAIYGTQPWKYQNDSHSDVWYTSRGPATYAILLKWPELNCVTLGNVKSLFMSPHTAVTMLGWEVPNELKWVLDKDKVQIFLPDKSKILTDWAWVLKIK